MSQKSMGERRFARYAKQADPLAARIARTEANKQKAKAKRLAYRERRLRNATPAITGQCGRKIKHKSYADAMAHLVRLDDATGMRVYKCLICTGYHVGHIKK